ncbi:MAG: regulatory protein RecX [Demequinaceae bacterium]|nr:regulatory protein RecX [Demequinaceae bacterium]
MDPAERAREIALRILSGAPRSAAHLRERLLAKGVEEAIADEVIRRYREVGLLDDRALSAAIARARHRERGHARGAIRDELRRKGFEDSDIEAALTEVSDDDERSMASILASRHWEATRGLDDEARTRRVVGALGRRGYRPGIAFPLVRALKDADIWDNLIGEAEATEED